VFGSFGWSGEAVDEMEAKLKDGGYGFAFKPIKVKFKPTATVRAGGDAVHQQHDAVHHVGVHSKLEIHLVHFDLLT
jgi:hypothetical protein